MSLSVFLEMWRHPRLVGWGLLIGVSVALMRVLSGPHGVLPGVVWFDPGLVVALAGGMFAGPAGVLGSLVGSWAGDWAIGEGGAGSWVRVIGFGGAAWAAGADWRGGWGRDRALGRFVAAGVLGCLVAAAWQGLGAEAERLFPYAYAVKIGLFFQLGFWLVFSPALFVAGRYWASRFDSWRGLLNHQATLGAWTSAVAWIGGIGAAGTGFLVSVVETGRGAVEPALLGAQGGPGTRAVVIALLSLHMGALLVGGGVRWQLPGRRKGRAGIPAGGKLIHRLRQLRLPPLERR